MKLIISPLHILKEVTSLPPTLPGAALYLLYGIHSSTAASEFPLLPPAPVGGSPRQPSPKISLQPLALQPHSIVSHIVPSHRSHPSSQRRLAELDTVFIQH